MGPPSFTWGDLHTVIVNLPQESALARSVQPDDAPWTLAAQLLAEIADGVRWLQWSKTKDAEHNRNRPKPIPRPGVTDQDKGRRITAKPATVDEIAEWLGDDFAAFRTNTK